MAFGYEFFLADTAVAVHFLSGRAISLLLHSGVVLK